MIRMSHKRLLKSGFGLLCAATLTKDDPEIHQCVSLVRPDCEGLSENGFGFVPAALFIECGTQVY